MAWQCAHGVARPHLGIWRPHVIGSGRGDGAAAGSAFIGSAMYINVFILLEMQLFQAYVHVPVT